MSGRAPDEIWEDSLDEGERRLAREPAALAATGFAGGLDVSFGLLAVIVTTGALTTVMPDDPAHVLGSLTFGFAFVFITLGRAELFTENFLIPVGAVYAGRSTISRLLRMWGVTFGANAAGLLLFAAIFGVSGVLEPSALDAVGALADTQVQRDAWAALLSGIAAGTVMTLFTWVVAAAEDATARLLASLLVGFVLLAPSLNHCVVGFGEIVFGMIAGTTTADIGDLLRTVGLAIAGNLIGGVGLVFLTRLAQVRGEPGTSSGSSTRGN